MKPLVLLSLLLSGCLMSYPGLRAQTAPVVIETEAPVRSPEDLDQLLGPIALYPDALIALILPSATHASDVVLASRYLAANGDVSRLDQQSWDESVRALARYPEVVAWMDENLEWTQAVGDAFIAQPADVMNAIQRLRAAARAAGTLIDTPQQRIVADGADLLIVPAQPRVIYVPRYDPVVVFHHHHHSGWRQPSLFTFSSAFAVGPWLYYDVDWRRRTIWIAPPHPPGRPHRQHWHRPPPPGRPGHVHDSRWRRWQPPPARGGRTAPPPRHWQRPAAAPASSIASSHQRRDVPVVAPARPASPDPSVRQPSRHRLPPRPAGMAAPVETVAPLSPAIATSATAVREQRVRERRTDRISDDRIHRGTSASRTGEFPGTAPGGRREHQERSASGFSSAPASSPVQAAAPARREVSRPSERAAAGERREPGRGRGSRTP